MYMSIREFVQVFIPKLDSPEKVYELFLGLGYPRDKILDPTYKRKVSELELAKEEREKIRNLKVALQNYRRENYNLFLMRLASTLPVQSANRSPTPSQTARPSTISSSISSA